MTDLERAEEQILSEPGWLLRQPSVVLGELLAQEALPESVVRVLMVHPSRTIRFAAEHHVAVAGEAGSGWQEDLWDHLACDRTKNKARLLRFLRDCPVPQPLLERFAACEDAALRAAVVQRAPNLPLVGLLQRASGSPSLQKIIAPDPTLSLDDLTTLARNSRRFAQRCALAQPHLTPALLAEFAEKPDLFLQVQVARHAHTSEETRSALAARGNAALDRALARTDRVVYRAPEPKTGQPKPVRRTKPPHTNTLRQRRAATRFLTGEIAPLPSYTPPQSLFQRLTERLRLGDLEFAPPSTTLTEKERYDQLPTDIRVALARRHDLPLSVRNLCAHDEAAAVREALRTNPTLPASLRHSLTLQYLPGQRPEPVRSKPAPLTPESVLWYDGKLLRFLGLLALRNLGFVSRAGVPQQSDLVASGRWEDRLVLALHPSLAAAHREVLQRDGHIWVRAAARDQS